MTHPIITECALRIICEVTKSQPKIIDRRTRSQPFISGSLLLPVSNWTSLTVGKGTLFFFHQDDKYTIRNLVFDV